MSDLGKLIRDYIAGWLITMALQVMSHAMLINAGPSIVDGLHKHERYLRSRHV